MLPSPKAHSPDAQRIAALLQYDILGSPREAAFDRVTNLVAMLLDAPMAGIHFIDDRCQWAKSQTGFDEKQIPSDVSFCAVDLETQDLLVVEDLADDDRFKDNPFVTGEAGIRFYAGAVLKSPEGIPLGRLCVLDTRPRPGGLTEREQETLTQLAGVVMDELEYRAKPRHRERILESITDGFIAVNQEGQVTYVNHQAAELLHRAPGELIGTDIWDSFHDTLNAPSYDAVVQSISEGESAAFEAYLPSVDAWFDIRIYPIEKEGLSLYLRDVTEQKKLETALREREEYLSVTLDSICDAVITTDTDRRITEMNPIAEELTGWRVDEVRGRSINEILQLQHIQTGAPIEHPVDEILRGSQHATRTEHTLLTAKDGTKRRISDSAAPIRSRDGSQIGVVVVFRDETEMIERREALEKHRERLEMALIGGRVGMWDWNMQTNATVYDERWAAILGYKVDELKYHNSFFEQHTHPDDLKRVYADIDRHARGELPYLDQEIRMRHKDGSWRWVLDRARIVERDEDGTPLRMVGTHVDITERKRAEQQLRDSEERFDLAIQGSQDGLWDWDMSTDAVWYSPRFSQLVGWPEDEFEHHLTSWTDILHPDDYEPTMEAIQTHLREKVPFDVEYRCRAQNGTYGWFQARGQAVWDEDGEPVRMAGSITEISDRKRRESIQQRFGRLLRAAPSEIYVFDAETLRFVQTSQGAQDNLGYSSDELKALTPLDLKPFSRSEFEELLAPLRSGETDLLTFETTHRRNDGSTYPVQVRLQLNRKDMRPVFIAIVLDITERVEREDELIRAKERAEEMSRLKSSFLANMSHEIRTPLTAIIGFAEVLQDELEGTDANMLSMILRSGRRLERTLTSVLDLAQLESKTVELSVEQIDLSAEIHEAVSMFERAAEEKGLRLDVDVPDEPVPADLDLGAVQRILTNLISNAVKFTEEGSVRVGLRTDDTHVKIDVEDTGIGIEPAYAEKIFREFTQESDGYTRTYEGVGLGLHITKLLLDLLGGEIALETEKGVGSRFTATLPVSVRNADTAPDAGSDLQRTS